MQGILGIPKASSQTQHSHRKTPVTERASHMRTAEVGTLSSSRHRQSLVPMGDPGVSPGIPQTACTLAGKPTDGAGVLSCTAMREKGDSDPCPRVAAFHRHVPSPVGGRRRAVRRLPWNPISWGVRPLVPVAVTRQRKAVKGATKATLAPKEEATVRSTWTCLHQATSPLETLSEVGVNTGQIMV